MAESGKAGRPSAAASVSADFPFTSRFVEVGGARMHYIDEGAGAPVLFLHGNPTSSYLWRNVVPHVAPHARCIAPDLIGMGRSDKPDIPYRFGDHARYLDAFVAKLGLRDVTLVLHDWGSALGFRYAMRNEGNVRGIAFMEALVKTWRWEDFPAGFRAGFRLFRTPVVGWVLIGWLNLFVRQILPRATVRRLSEEEMRRYAEPYLRVRDRRPLWRWPNEIPIEGRPADVAAVVEAYSAWLRRTEIPKLLLRGEPGGIIGEGALAWCRENLKNLLTVDVGPGIHYLQEDNPHVIGAEIAAWLRGLPGAA